MGRKYWPGPDLMQYRSMGWEHLYSPSSSFYIVVPGVIWSFINTGYYCVFIIPATKLSQVCWLSLNYFYVLLRDTEIIPFPCVSGHWNPPRYLIPSPVPDWALLIPEKGTTLVIPTLWPPPKSRPTFFDLIFFKSMWRFFCFFHHQPHGPGLLFRTLNSNLCWWMTRYHLEL